MSEPTPEMRAAIQRRYEHDADCPFGKHIALQERIDAIARALYVAGLRSSLDKDGLPRLIASGVYWNLRKVQRLDLFLPKTAEDFIAEVEMAQYLREPQP